MSAATQTMWRVPSASTLAESDLGLRAIGGALDALGAHGAVA